MFALCIFTCLLFVLLVLAAMFYNTLSITSYSSFDGHEVKRVYFQNDRVGRFLYDHTESVNFDSHIRRCYFDHKTKKLYSV